MKRSIAIVTAVFCIIGGSNARADQLWIDDVNGEIGKVNTSTGAVTLVGQSGQTLTDIAFAANGALYGITFNNLYSISTSGSHAGHATLIGSLGGGPSSGFNALVFGTNGVLYATSNNTTDLYSINTSTGAASNLGSIGKNITSAGDLAFNGGALYESSGNNNGTSDLIKITLKANGTVSGSTDIGNIGSAFTNVYGLATASNGTLYGVSGTKVFSINTTTGAGKADVNYAGHGLGNANGTSFITEAVPTPEPSGFLFSSLLAAGMIGIGVLTRRKRDVAIPA